MVVIVSIPGTNEEVEFPDNTSDDVINQAMNNFIQRSQTQENAEFGRLLQQERQQQQQQTLLGQLEQKLQSSNLASNLVQGARELAEDVPTSVTQSLAQLPIGIAEKSLAGLELAGVDQIFGKDITEARKLVQQAGSNIASEIEAAQARSPIAATVAGVGSQTLQLGGLGGGVVNSIREAALVGGKLGLLTGGLKPSEEFNPDAGQTILDSLQNAVTEGFLSAATGGFIKGAVDGGGFLGKRIKEIVKKIPAIDLSKAERFIADNLTKTDILKVGGNIQSGIKSGNPIPLVQAANNPTITGAAEVLRNNKLTSRVINSDIDSIAKQLSANESKFIKEIAPNVTTAEEGASLFSQGVTAIRDSFVEARKLKSAPLYAKANKKSIPLNDLDELTSNEFLMKALKSTRSQLASTKTRELPVDSVEIWNTTKQFLDADISALQRSRGNGKVIGELIEAKDSIKNVISRSNPDYKKALKQYSDDSEVLNELIGKGKALEPFGQLLKTADKDPVKAMQDLFTLSPTDIAKTRRMSKNLGFEESFDSGVRGFVMQSISKKKDGTLLDDVFGDPLKKRQLAAAIGEQRAGSLIDVIKAKNDFTSFFKNISREIKKNQAESSKILRKASATVTGKAASRIFSTGERVKKISTFTSEDVDRIVDFTEDPKFTRELTNILFKPQTGVDTAIRIGAAKTREAKERVISNRVIRPIVDQLIREEAISGEIRGTIGEQVF